MSNPTTTKEPETPDDDASASEEAAAQTEQPEQAAGDAEGQAAASDDNGLSEVERMHQQVAGHAGDDEAALDALDELARRAEQHDAAQEALAEAQGDTMRKAAKLQNERRRARREQSRAIKRAKADVLRRVLGVLDDFDRSLEAADQVEEHDEPDYEAAHRSLKEGVEMVYNKFQSVLREMDVEPIEAVGQPFDEKLHEAMMQQPAPDDAEPGEVLHEVQKGYRMDDNVLRHSRVVVASEREEEAADDA